ncbi:ABC transporter ATP-binding protein [Desulfoferrobacter suflitae]|uniref:ABC transporter ATP-binding protein n=1 Tax=Desulfoferrobacter suflitae TaxID=2865782 RepID=UPI002164BB5B|nr:ATP-binding cassette domain-containing protein [Desulfoferrobacter suflitae]MCK8603593.1 ATP-binding cassette domain-containing protein [Desulfoferrobacter suflitae]
MKDNVIDRGLECRGVTLIHEGAGSHAQTVLQNVSARFHAGCIALITGVTGAGKSSLLHILAGLLRPSSGTVYAAGQPVSRWISAYRDLWRRKVGMLFQNPHFLYDLTALENIMLPLAPRGFDGATVRKRALTLLDQLELSQLAGRNVATLSGGQKQRLSMARALMGEPLFLLADEPTAHQDERGCRVMLQLLQAAGENEATVVIAAHDARCIQANIADDRWLLANGQLKRIE